MDDAVGVKENFQQYRPQMLIGSRVHPIWYIMNLSLLQVGIVFLCFHTAPLSGTPTTGLGQQQVDLELTVLSDNDYEAEDTTRTSRAILIGTTQSWGMAPNACSLIHETLWSPDLPGQAFNKGLNNTLNYQKYLGNYPKSQKYWIKSATGCKTIDVDGKISDEDCHKRLPTLCTNSAPASNATFMDNSPPRRVSRKVGNQVVTGYRDSNSFRFLGLRYAVYPQKFTHSTLYEGTGSASALEYGSSCLQSPPYTGTTVGSEDCLFMNLWTPYLPGKHINSKKLKPVIIWIHGGGLLTGTGNEPGCDGGNSASRGDIVSIAINYRLGTLGWLSLDNEIRGNFGLGDMINALKWIKANAKTFGGDPNKVTIMGQSGGAGGVRALLASKKTKGLIHGAILQSGPWGLGPPRVYDAFHTSQYEASTTGVQVTQQLGCDTAADKLACIRSKTGEEIQLISTWVNYPLIDQEFLFGELGVTGKPYAANIPILLGDVRDELAIILDLYGARGPTATETLSTTGVLIIGDDLSKYVGNPAFPYPPGPAVDAEFNVANRIINDYGIICLNWATAYALTKHNVVPAVYTYSFNRTYQPPGFNYPTCNPPLTAEHPLGDFDAEYLKCHAGEVTLTFGDVKYVGQVDRDGKDVRFSQLASDIWTAFVRTGNPSPSIEYSKARGYWSVVDRLQSAPAWEKYNWQNPQMRVIQWDSINSPISEVPQCNAIGMPVTFYES